jgi:hypothetical protein
VCVPKGKLGDFCTADVHCKSSLCGIAQGKPQPVCIECTELDGNCPTANSQGKYCDGWSFTCKDKKPNGGLCLHDNACQSGHCSPLGVCSQCSTIDSREECGGNGYCDGWTYTCKPLKNTGEVCTSSKACRSGKCNGICRECLTPDSTSECPSGQFCYGWTFSCKPRMDRGSICTSGNACKSGKCPAGICVDCTEVDGTAECPAGKFCYGWGNTCVDRLNNGAVCSSNNACKSGKCRAGFCVECGEVDSTADCPNGQFCSGYGFKCIDRYGWGTPCSSNNACKSGKCWGLCTRP